VRLGFVVVASVAALTLNRANSRGRHHRDNGQARERKDKTRNSEHVCISILFQLQFPKNNYVVWAVLPGHSCFNFFAESDTPHPCRIPTPVSDSKCYLPCPKKILTNRTPAPESDTDTRTRVHVTLCMGGLCHTDLPNCCCRVRKKKRRKRLKQSAA